MGINQPDNKRLVKEEPDLLANSGEKNISGGGTSLSYQPIFSSLNSVVHFDFQSIMVTRRL
jgi:hypothetical protein